MSKVCEKLKEEDYANDNIIVDELHECDLHVEIIGNVILL